MPRWRRRSLDTNAAILAEETVATTAVAENLGKLHEALERVWVMAGQALLQPLDPVWQGEFSTALAEIGANIVRHAYPATGVPGPVCLRLRLYTDRVEARFADYGIPYVLSDRPEPLVDDDILALPEGGYGLALARAALDQLHYRRTAAGTNCWRLVKRFSR